MLCSDDIVGDDLCLLKGLCVENHQSKTGTRLTTLHSLKKGMAARYEHLIKTDVKTNLANSKAYM